MPESSIGEASLWGEHGGLIGLVLFATFVLLSIVVLSLVTQIRSQSKERTQSKEEREVLLTHLAASHTEAKAERIVNSEVQRAFLTEISQRAESSSDKLETALVKLTDKLSK